MNDPDLERAVVELGVEEEEASAVVEAFTAGDPTALLRHLLIRALWDECLPDGAAGALSVQRWPELVDTSFPFLDAAALERALAAGANADDINAIVRSAQVCAMYNVAQALDDGWAVAKRRVGEDAAHRLGWALVACPPTDPPPPGLLGGLHSAFEEMDPAGRHGAPPLTDES